MRRIGRIAGVIVGVIIALALTLAAALYRAEIPAAKLHAKYFTPESQYLVARGDSLHVRVRGQGPALFLLHGSFASLHTWNAWESELSNHYQTISLDFPGHGLTGPSVKKQYSTDDYAQSVLAVADQLGIDSFYVAGNSMGGLVAYKLAIRSKRVKKLILIDAAGAPNPSQTSVATAPRPWIFRLLANPATSRPLTKLTPRILFEKVMGGVFADRSRVTPAMIDRYYELMLREGNRVATLERLQTPQLDSRDSLNTISIPTLIIWGAADTWIPVSHAQRFGEAIPESSVEIFANAGHVPMEEIPEQTLPVVQRFLNQKPRNDGQ
jgi:pimeloyl-ACP methyl ester carboxylesterase